MITLSDEQKVGLDLMHKVAVDGGLAYQTGNAGSGKSTNLRQFLRERPRVPVLAPTGIAAINVGGFTVNKFFGWRPGETGVKRLRRRNKKVLEQAGALVIDEISMFRADAMDRMDRDLRVTFESSEPFGGIGIFCIGDHFQLEPVLPREGCEREYFDRRGYTSPYWFDSHVWQACKPEYIQLTKVFRQQGDTAFTDALNRLRLGEYESLAYLNKRAGEIPASGAIKLCFHNKVANEINETELMMLSGEAKTYRGITVGDVSEHDLPSPRELSLKVGARVVAVVNDPWSGPLDDPRFTNGDLGTVTTLNSDSVVVLFDRGCEFEIGVHSWEFSPIKEDETGDLFIDESKDAPCYSQIPLKLAYAISVHKSQGMTLDKVHIQIPSTAFAAGQTYVALSRCRNFETMTISRPLRAKDVRIHPRVAEWHRQVFGE